MITAKPSEGKQTHHDQAKSKKEAYLRALRAVCWGLQERQYRNRVVA